MAFPDVDLLGFVAKCFPRWGERIRLHPPAIHWNGRWRKILSTRLESDGVLLRIEGGRPIRLAFQDPAGSSCELQPERLFWILQDNPGYRLRSLRCKTDRVRRQSGAFLRLLLQRGSRRRAVLVTAEAAPLEQRDRLLTALVLWWDLLCLEPGPIDARLYIPDHWRNELANGLRHLNIPASSRFLGPSPAEAGDCSDRGLSSRLAPVATVLPELASIPPLLGILAQTFSCLDLQPRKGRWELSYRGLALARGEEGAVRIHPGVEVAGVAEALSLMDPLLERVREERSFPPHGRSRLYRFHPERWLESLVVRNLRSLIPDAMGPVYAQVPSYISGHRKVLDLLTVDSADRLLILELKVEKELSVVFQALDYWSRVKIHLEAGDFRRRGYFPGRRLSRRAPRIVLLAPLFEFHPILPTLRRCLREHVRFECIGVNADWRRHFRVLSRFDF